MAKGRLDALIGAAERISRIGEDEDDKAARLLRRAASWGKHLLAIEVALVLLAGIPFLAAKKISEGKADELVGAMAELAPLAFAEQGEEIPAGRAMAECPECGKIFEINIEGGDE